MVQKRQKIYYHDAILHGNITPTAKIFYFIKHTITM